MRREIQNISSKLDAFTVLRQETEDEGKFPKLVNEQRPTETVNYNSVRGISLKVQPRETSRVFMALAATDKSQNKTKQNEFCARHDKLMVRTTLQVVFKDTRK